MSSCAAVTECINIILISFCEYMSLLCTLQHEQFVLTDFNEIWYCGAVDNCENVIKSCSLFGNWFSCLFSFCRIFIHKNWLNKCLSPIVRTSIRLLEDQNNFQVRIPPPYPRYKSELFKFIVLTWISHSPFPALSFTYCNLKQGTHTIVVDVLWFLYCYFMSNTPVCIRWFKL